jgi:hypothetical protein
MILFVPSKIQKTKAHLSMKQSMRNQRRKKQQSQQQRPKASLLYQQLVDKAITKIQNSLITQTVSYKYLCYVTQILQPPHCQDIMDERVLASKCAWPCCSHVITGRQIYCSEVCEREANKWISECDSSVPFTRDCVKLLSMVFPNFQLDKIEQLKQDMDKEYNSTALVASLRVKEREVVSPPQTQFEKAETLDTIAQEAKKFNTLNSQLQSILETQHGTDLSKRMEAMSIFYDSEDEEEEQQLEMDNFTLLWTVFSRWYTGHTFHFFHPNISVNNTTSLTNTDPVLSESEMQSMQVYGKMFKDLNMMTEYIDATKHSQKPAFYNNYTFDPIFRDSQSEQRFQIVEQSLNQYIAQCCSEFSLISSQVLDLVMQLLNTYTFTQRLSSFNLQQWNMAALLIVNALYNHKEEEIKGDNSPQKGQFNKAIRSKLKRYHLTDSQIDLLLDLIVNGVYSNTQ